MHRSEHVRVKVDLSRVRQNAERILRDTRVPLIAVVKADAYGLGASAVARAIGDLVEGFYVFDAAEAVDARLFETTGKRSIALVGQSDDSADYLARHIQPAVWTAERAALLRQARPVLSVDTGQQRFGCSSDAIADVLARGECREAFTHASTPGQVERFREWMDPYASSGVLLHAAGSSLLHEPRARLGAVRPGLALYLGAVRVSAVLVEARDGQGPAGYSGFVSPRHGVIRCGYSNGFRFGPCAVNGRLSRILEVGMQTAFVELGAGDKVGDEVVLLGDGVSEDDISREWNTSSHECLVRLTGAGIREYVGT